MLFASTVEMGRAIFTACLLGFTGAIDEQLKSGNLTREQSKTLIHRGGDIMAALLMGQSVRGVSLDKLGPTTSRVNEAISLTTSLFALSKIDPEASSAAWNTAQKKPQPWQSDEGSNIEG